jgi:hypothetical protein
VKKQVMVLGAVLMTACASPTKPTTRDGPIPQETRVVDLAVIGVHNLPATMPDGSTVWICTTEPRVYVLEGVAQPPVRDHYVVPSIPGRPAMSACPAQPIE